MGSRRIVVPTEVFDDDAGRGERILQEFPVQTLFAEATLEAFHKAGFPRTRRRDVDRPGLLVRQPTREIVGDKLGAVVGADKFWRAGLGDGRWDQRDYAGRADPSLGPQDVDFLGCSSRTVSMRNAPPCTVASATKSHVHTCPRCVAWVGQPVETPRHPPAAAVAARAGLLRGGVAAPACDSWSSLLGAARRAIRR